MGNDEPATPRQRAATAPRIDGKAAIRMNADHHKVRPAALSRQILALTGLLETLATAKHQHPSAPRSTRTGTTDPTGGFPMTQRMPLREGIDVRQQVGPEIALNLSTWVMGFARTQGSLGSRPTLAPVQL
jgi:hypothetical protein